MSSHFPESPFRRVTLSRGLPIIVPLLVALAVALAAFDSGAYSDSARAALGIAVLWALLVGVGLGVWPRAPIPRPAVPVAGLLALLCVVIGLSALWATSDETVLSELDRGTLYLALYVLAVVGVGVGRGRLVIAGLALGIVAVALASLLTRLFPGLAPGEPTALLPALGSRLSYPLGYWNGLAVFAALAMPLLLGTATSSRSRYPALSLAAVPTLASVIVLASSRGGMLTAGAALVAFAALSRRRARALAAVVVAAGAAGAAFAILHQRPHLLDAPKAAAAVGEGRSAALLLLALSIATPLGFFVLGRGFEKVAGMPALRRRSVRAGLLAAVAALALAAIALAHPVARWNDFTRAPSLTESRQPAYVQRHLLSDSGSGRWQMWRAAVEEFRSRPLLGRGAGSFEQWWTQRRPLALTTRDAHSLYLEAAAETGLLGSIPLAALLVAAGLTLGRRLRRLRGGERELAAALGALLVAYAVAAGIDWMWEMTVVSAIAFVALGLVAGPGVSGADLRVVRAPSRRLSRVSLVLGSILVGWVLLCAQAIPFFAQSRLRASADAARAGNTRTALTAARQAQRIEPWASSPRLQEALVHEAAGRLRPAQQEIQAAIRRDPDDWRLWLVATRIAVKRAQPVRANVALARVRALNPLLEVALTG